MAAITIAKDRGLEVFATTRQEGKRSALEAAGADHVVLDDGEVGARVHVDGLFELVGPRTIFDSLKAVGARRDGPASPGSSSSTGTSSPPAPRRSASASR